MPLVSHQTIEWVCDICKRRHTVADRIAVDPYSDRHVKANPCPPPSWIKFTPRIALLIDGAWVEDVEVVCCQHNIQMTGTNKS